MKHFLLLAFIITAFNLQAQQKRIEILHADINIIDEEKYPNQEIGLGDVVVVHEGMTLRCKKAEYYKLKNIIRAYGNVVINIGDTITQTSDYVQYNGDTKKAKSWGEVVLTDPDMTMTTDTLDFDRVKEVLYYKSGAIIKDSVNVLESKIGNYYLKTSKFEALSDVVLTNPDYVLNGEHLDYYTDNGQAFLYGPSTIVGEDNHIYTENGFYDTQKGISHFTKNSVLTYKDRSITADSLYYDRNQAFASATNNIKMLDTLNKVTVRGNYGEFYQELDSAYVINRAVAITEIEKDSMYVHGDTLLITGKPENRIIRAYNRVKFFKSNLSGKCDSIHSNQKTGLTQMFSKFKKPILWSQESQITGDTIHLISNPETEKLDSLKILRNAFVIQKDSAGYNQIKGRNILGQFINNKLEDVNVIGNSESIFYARNEEEELIGIDKMTCSYINFKLKDNKIITITYFTDPEGPLTPPSKIPLTDRKFPGFTWRDNERPYKMEDIFIKDKSQIDTTKEEKPLKAESAIEKDLEQQK